ncbi:MAG: hypothetical protein HY923_07510 [Elusimicrobia bacterium]|nr:hypothetical protein [Elusimicrobiota bacterium]
MRPLLLVLLAAALTACAKAEAAPQAKKSNPLWSEIIAEHSVGRLSRKAAIVLRFNKDVFAKDQVGARLEGLIETIPKITGAVVATGPREATFTPASLKPGSQYLVRVKASGLADAPAGIGDYEFVVSVLERDLSLKLAGGFPDAAAPGKWSVRGSVETADVEDAPRVEKALTAEWGDGSPQIIWTHEAGTKSHAFSIGGLSRGASAKTLKLTLDGRVIGGGRREVQSVEIPADASFRVVGTRAISDGPQYVLVSFSDTLDSAQDLRGLVRLSSGTFTFRVEGSALKIFPQDRINGIVVVSVETGVRDAKGRRLERRIDERLRFTSVKPQVRFTGGGVILPDNDVLSIPFEAINVHSVQVTAFRVYADNIGQFLQTNALPGDQEMGRVGRFMWRKTIRVEPGAPDQWRHLALDAGQLLRGNRGALMRLTVSINRGDSDYACSEEAGSKPVKPEEPLKDHDDLNTVQPSYWSGYEEGGEDGEARTNWAEREDPCKDAYYEFATGTKESRNFMGSNIGMIAVRGQTGDFRVAVSSLRTAAPLSKAAVTVHNFQGAVIARSETDADGFAKLSSKGKPFYLTASKDGDRGYLKVSDGLALPVSHFDTGGERVESGLKGLLYGERGVWRPGDDVHLTLIVEDREGRLPPGHPAVLRLFDPRGKPFLALTNREPLGGFYRFSFRTPEDAPTGLWSAKARVGGAEFSKELRVEAVLPNRLKIELDFGRKSLRAKAADSKVKLFAQWLHGAKAGGLKAAVDLKLTAAPTKFTRFTDHVFDDPARSLSAESRTVFEGTLDADGRAEIPLSFPADQSAPGMLTAQFHARVFENEGAFSSTRQTTPFHPYERYVGLKLPEGDRARGMLLTDTTHQVSVVSLDADGKPASASNIKMTVYKVEWKWWWDKSGSALAQFANNTNTAAVQQGTVSTRDGRGIWTFNIHYPDWGRYLLRACDEESGHCTGKIFYIDWPGWAGRAREQGGAGANVLSFDADSPDYKVGETARLRLPAAQARTRALISIENGTRVLSQRWVELSTGPTTVPLAITKAMTPNVYVAAFVVQAHEGKANDRPLRLYGVIPLTVKDPATELAPVIAVAAEWKPETRQKVTVSEAKGRPMVYTLAVVDEGLLGLTGFPTPDPHAAFYKKEALGVTTWDLYDHVVGSYGGELERLLALGGSEALGELREKESSRRFPPIVRFMGPFELKPYEKKSHEVALSSYVGALRVMVVAGRRGAYGHADKTVPVRQPLMVQPTLPRVVGPGEDIVVPAAVFAMDDKIKQASVEISADGPFTVVGPRTAELVFAKPGDKLARFSLRSGSRLGTGKIRVAAKSGADQARAEINLTVRAPNPPTARQAGKWLEPGEVWKSRIVPHGMPGTNEVTLEASSIPPLNLEKRLGDLIRYPYGCLEQTTSALFPQFFLPGLVRLTEREKAEVEKNVKGGLDRLRGFQAPSGGFYYWPQAGHEEDFATSYVGQFLLEAEKRGYALPPEMRPQWEKFQRERALAWNPGSPAKLEQAYRLYTLALAGKPELGAMNQLREDTQLKGLTRWLLAGAYQAAGVTAASDALAQSTEIAVPYGQEGGQNYPSPLRDKSLVLQMLTLRREFDRAMPLADQVSGALASEQWHHTQALAQSLMSLSRYYGEQEGERGFALESSVNGAAAVSVASNEPVRKFRLAAFPDGGSEVAVRNTSRRKIYVALVTRGISAAGEEKPASHGLEITVDYRDPKGAAADPARLLQGQQLTAVVTVRNLVPRKVDNIALAFLAPAGWEINNAPWAGAGDTGLDYQDVRDDRVLSFFGLAEAGAIQIPLKFTAAYQGRFYLPAAVAEAMYESTLNANSGGRWVAVDAGR